MNKHSRFCLNIDISNLGELIILDQFDSITSQPDYFVAHPRQLQSQQIDIYMHHQKTGHKILTYDDHNRVISNAFYINNQLTDTWIYEYHPTTGFRSKKSTRLPDGTIINEISY